jgi:endonuclease V-like protein UPF0215 family
MAVDDGPFAFGDAAALLVGLVVRGQGYLEGVQTGRASVDALDSTEAIAAMVGACPQRSQLKALLLDGLTFAGFNVVDIAALHERTGVPVMTLVDKRPDPTSIRRALEGRFPDWEQRWRLLQAPALHRIGLSDGAELTAHLAGISPADARALLEVTTLRGHLPEAMRMAHLVASGVPRLAEVASWTAPRPPTP